MANRKLVVIGAGSAYTPEIFNGILERNHILQIDTIELVDIESGKGRAEIIADFGKRMFKAAGQSCNINLCYDQRQVLAGADFVISQIRVGGGKARSKDEHLCFSLGLLGQETTGAGGFMNAMRTIPVALQIARDMEELCPDAWLINFTNPAGMVTEAILKHSKVKCIGLCNVPINMQADAAKILGTDREAVRCTTVGLNHLSFVTSVMVDGKESLPNVIRQIDGNETLMKNIPKVEGVGELIKAIGILPSPYLQYYYFEDAMIQKQKKELEANGKTRGDLVREIDETMFVQYTDTKLTKLPAQLGERGGSLYSRAALDIVEALLSEEPRELVVNVQNNGAIYNLLPQDVVEMNCFISKKGVEQIDLGYLPDAVSGLVQSVKQYERLTLEAAICGSRSLAIQALLNHPLIHGFKNAKRVVEAMESAYPEYVQLKD